MYVCVCVPVQRPRWPYHDDNDDDENKSDNEKERRRLLQCGDVKQVAKNRQDVALPAGVLRAIIRQFPCRLILLTGIIRDSKREHGM